jgi:hypothetical protein
LWKGDDDILVLTESEIVTNDVIRIFPNSVRLRMVLLNLSKIPGDNIRSDAGMLGNRYKKKVAYLVTIEVSASFRPALNLAGVKDIFWPPLNVSQATC